MIGGSFLCRDPDGEVRNAFVLADRHGVVGRHDKDLPTAWENAFYIGGSDDGVIDAGDLSVGVAMCWELIRSQTARRLRGRVDVVVGGSNWVTFPAWHPRVRDPASRGPECGACGVCPRRVRPIRRSAGGARCHRRRAGVQVARPTDDDLPRPLPRWCDDRRCTRSGSWPVEKARKAPATSSPTSTSEHVAPARSSPTGSGSTDVTLSRRPCGTRSELPGVVGIDPTPRVGPPSTQCRATTKPAGPTGHDAGGCRSRHAALDQSVSGLGLFALGDVLPRERFEVAVGRFLDRDQRRIGGLR